MLKKYEYLHNYFFLFILQWVIKNQTKLTLFWSFWQINFVNPSLILFFMKRRYFFFKFLRLKIPKKTPHLLTKNKFKKHKTQKHDKKRRFLTWFMEKTSTYLDFKGLSYRRYLWPGSTRRWIRYFVRRQRFSRMRRRFLRQLSRRILKSQLFAGNLLFNTKSRANLKRFFQFFRGVYNNPGLTLKTLNRFFFLCLFHRFRWMRSRLSHHVILNSSSFFNITYFNLQSFFFKKLKIKLRKFKKYSQKSRFLYKKKRNKRSRRKHYKWISSRNFIFKHRYQKHFPRTLIYFKDPLTQTYVFNKSSKPILNFYLFYIINIWNIRSYNWRQIT